jgi:uncharacterized protein (DUF2225 family)
MKTTFEQIELACPVCETHFHFVTVVSADTVLGRRTDFHEQSTGVSSLPHLIHVCSRCGYAGGEDAFGDDVEVEPALRAHVWRELAPAKRDDAQNSSGPQSLRGSDKYEAAAKVAEWRGEEPRRLGELFLRAAWCCVDERDTEAERYFRRKAAWAFERALADGTVPRDERAVLTYLVAELWRRIGDVKKAATWFGAVPAEVLDPARQRWILDLARQQRTAPREWMG